MSVVPKRVVGNDVGNDIVLTSWFQLRLDMPWVCPRHDDRISLSFKYGLHVQVDLDGGLGR
jgi:hypothetical protein